MLVDFFRRERSDASTIDFVVRLACVSLFVTYIFAYKQFTVSGNEASFAPLFEVLIAIPQKVHNLIYNLALLSVIYLFLKPESKTTALFICIQLIYFICRELSMLQPFYYMYITTIMVGVLWRDKPLIALNALRIMVGGVYFWAGYHKINLTFYAEVFPWFINPFYQLDSGKQSYLDYVVVGIMLLVPLFEALIGVFLVFRPRARKAATLMSFTMLVVVLACLGPFGHNWAKIVWPWNVYLFLMEFVLFFHFKEKLVLSWKREYTICIVSALMFWILPVMAMYNPWMQLLGFKLYAGNIYKGLLVLDNQNETNSLPEGLKKKIEYADKGADKGKYLLHYMDIAIFYKKTIAHYPYVMMRTSQGLCKYLGENSTARMRILKPNPFYSLNREYEEFPLCKVSK